MVDAARLKERLGATFAKKGAELSGLAVAVVEGGELAWEGAFGRRHIDPEDPSRDLPVEPDTKFRVASISKPVAAIGAMLLVERGLLDLDRDLSDYLGFGLRNPAFPGTPITAAMLLSHTSSIRDSGGYVVPLPHRLRDFVSPGVEGLGRLAWASPIEGRDVAPGRYFAYSNLNYGVLATVMERLSGERFDLYMRDRVLGPLGIDGGYNVALLSDEGLSKLAAIYRKAGPDGSWRPAGPWAAQVDDCRGRRPALPFRALPGVGPEALGSYAPGDNGTIFSPQGGLRISARDLAKILRLFLNGGEVDGVRLLSRESVARMTTSRWAYDPALRNGELYSGLTRETGLGLARTTAARDEQGGDRLLESGGPRLWGHHADAYGLLGGLLFDPEEGFGFVYLIGGTARAPEGRRGRYSSWFEWEEEIQAAILEESGRGEPYRTGLWRWRGAFGELGSFSFEGLSADEGELAFVAAEAAFEASAQGPGGTSELVATATSPVLVAEFPVSEAIPSWNVEAPEGSSLEVFLRARSGGTWTRWYALGEWREGSSPRPRRSIDGQDDADGKVRTDTLVLARPADALQYRLRLAVAADPSGKPIGGLPRVRNLALAFSSPKSAAPRAPRSEGDSARRGMLVEGVPTYSQMVYPDGGNTWCSPTCVSMVMAYWEGDRSEPEPRVRRTVAGVYDETWGGCGNWSFNAAYAGAKGCDAVVARFPSLAELEPFIAAGMPVVLSVSWDGDKGRPLAGAPVPRSAGHLTLLVGFDGKGDPVMNEPAAKDPSGVRRTYNRRELETRWLESSGGAVYLVVPRGRALPGRP
ncbi:MAG: serine hydrolase [Spirochaetaceae bacterium]|nr:serine hydrolase [Spirochaetaceae bacterium]